MPFIELDEAISVMYLPIRLLQPERQKKKASIKVKMTIDDVEGVTDDYGVIDSFDNWLCNRPDCYERQGV